MLVLDFEVFKYDWLVVIKDVTTGHYIKIHNDVAKLREIHAKFKDKLFVGFNSKRYDEIIFKVILLGGDPYYASNVIIEEENPLKLYSLFDLTSIKLYCIDLSQDAMKGSLKEFEGYLGLSIEESGIPFNIQRPLTTEEVKKTFDYCVFDVDATASLLKHRLEAVGTKLRLILEFGLDRSFVNKTNAQLVSKILGARKKTYDDELTPFDLSKLNINIENKDIIDFYTKTDLDYSKTMKLSIAGVDHVLAYGGLHGALENFSYRGEIWLIDVASYYPAMMIHYDYLSRGIPEDNRERFKNMFYDRLKLKKEGKKELADLYKLVLNTTYGCMKSQYNDLYDPKNANNVCIAGQLMLIDLIQNIQKYCKLVQSNTDGLVIIPNKGREKILRLLIADWELRTKMIMEVEIANGIYQKDVNNYILLKQDKVKVKGGYVSQSSMFTNRDTSYYLRNTMSIVDDAVVNYFVNGISPHETIHACNDLIKFQIITKTGGTYSKTVWENNNRLIEVQKVNRVFATLDTRLGKLYKLKTTNDVVRKDSIASLPDHCYVANNNIFDLSLLDKDFYVQVALRRISDFKGG